MIQVWKEPRIGLIKSTMRHCHENCQFWDSNVKSENKRKNKKSVFKRVHISEIWWGGWTELRWAFALVFSNICNFTSSQCCSFKSALIRSACSAFWSSFKARLMDEEEPAAKVAARFSSRSCQRALGHCQHPCRFHDELSCCDRMLLVICRHGYRLLMPFSDCYGGNVGAVQLSNLWRCRSCVGVEPWQWGLSLPAPL